MARRLYFSLLGIVVLVVSLLAGNLFAGNVPSLGLDLQGGASVTLQPEGDFTQSALNQAVEIISLRVNALGVSEPEITRQGDNVVVNLPGVDDQQKALDIIGRQGELLLRPVLQAGTLNTDTTTTIPGAGTSVPGSETRVAQVARAAGVQQPQFLQQPIQLCRYSPRQRCQVIPNQIFRYQKTSLTQMPMRY